MCNDVLAVDDLLQYRGQNVPLVHIQVDAIELGEADEIGADEDTQVATFHFALLSVTRVTLVLKAHPEFVHFDKVGEDEGNGVLEVSLGTLGGWVSMGTSSRTRLDSPGFGPNGQVIPGLTAEIVS